MNGRGYDYNLGRFLSVDPVIQSPGNSQSLNPYSYIMNNPLAGTDPTGYCAAATGTRIKDCGDLKVDVKSGDKVVGSAVVKNVNFKNGADVSSALTAGAGKALNQATMDIGKRIQAESKNAGGSTTQNSGNTSISGVASNELRSSDSGYSADYGAVDAEWRKTEQDAQGNMIYGDIYCNSGCKLNARNMFKMTLDDTYRGLMKARMAEMQSYSNSYTLSVLGASQYRTLVVPIVRGSYRLLQGVGNVYGRTNKEQRVACLSMVLTACTQGTTVWESSNATLPKPFVPVRPAESKYGSVADSVIHPRRFLDKMRDQSGVVD